MAGIAGAIHYDQGCHHTLPRRLSPNYANLVAASAVPRPHKFSRAEPAIKRLCYIRNIIG
jgi:hypothetical protein